MEAGYENEFISAHSPMGSRNRLSKHDGRELARSIVDGQFVLTRERAGRQ